MKKPSSKLYPKDDHSRTVVLRYVVLKKWLETLTKIIIGERSIVGTWF